MKIRRFVAAAFVLSAATYAGLAQEKAPKKPVVRGASATSSRATDEKLLRQSALDFAAAYNARDAKKIAAQFAPQAELVDVQGIAIQGREAIEKTFSAQFAEPLQYKMAIEIDTLRFLSDNLAVEEGRLVQTSDDDDLPHDRYLVIHVREGGKWLVASARDIIEPETRPSAHEHLKHLEGMVGDWVDEGADSVVVTSCRWDEKQNFLLVDYTTKIAGQPALSGTQRIGWDPLTHQLKTWNFDSEGGHSQGVWHRDGDRWIVQFHGVSADGRVGSATEIHTFLSEHAMSWQAVHRVLGGEPMPDTGEIKVVRAPPKPGGR
jgi:uncharacterized protein (TIGR02246 family)